MARGWQVYGKGLASSSKVFYLANTLPNSWEGREKYEAVAIFERSVDRPKGKGRFAQNLRKIDSKSEENFL